MADLDLNALLQDAYEIDQSEAEAEAAAAKRRQSSPPPAAPPAPPAAIDQPPPPPSQPADQDADDEPALRNELAEAERFACDILGHAWYCPQLGTKKAGEVESGWLIWDGTRLAASEDGAIYRLARRTALALSADYEAEAKDLYRLAVEKDQQARREDTQPAQAMQLQHQAKGHRAIAGRRLTAAERIQTEDRITKMIRHARNDARLIIDQNELDADENLINCDNGVLDLRTGALSPHDPSYRCTRLAPVPYDPQADRTSLMRLLNRALQAEDPQTGAWVTDTDRIRYLQDAIGHAAFGHQRLQKVYICQGAGGDGKGTLFEAILDALGGGSSGYAMKASMQSFVQAKVSSHRVRDDVANMRSARMIFASEINRGETLDEAFLKAMSGEDTQRVRHLYGKEFEFRPSATPFLQVNGSPRLDPTDKAIWRRVEIIPFGPPLTEDEKDPAVRQAMHDPADGGKALLAWIVEGAMRTHGCRAIKRAASVDAATAAFRAEQDLVAQFVADMLRLPPFDHVPKTYIAAEALKSLWQEWIDESGTSSAMLYNGKRMGSTLRELGCWPKQSRDTGKNRKTWYGVTCHPEHQRFDEHAADSFKPSEEAHLQRLTEAAAAGAVSLFPQAYSPRATRENEMLYARTRARSGSLFSCATDSEEGKGNKETDQTHADGGIPPGLDTTLEPNW